MDMHFDGVIFQTYADELARRIRYPHPSYRLLDVRAPSAWERGHVPGAESVTLDELTSDPTLATSAAELFVVGDGPDDPKVRAATIALRAGGARRIVEFPGGMLEWTVAGLPIE